MSAYLSEIRYGRIVWATLRDPRGDRKRRPAIVLTPDGEISPNKPLGLMAVTTTYRDPVGPDEVELPWNRDPRRVSTGLARRSAAIVTWLDSAYAVEIDAVIGTVPSSIMTEIQRRLQALQDRDV